MAMRKFWNYIKTWFGVKSEQIKDPEIEIEQAIGEARERDRELRNQAAKVIAHRTKLADDLEDASAESAEAKALAKQALVKADEATKAGNAAEAARWNQAAQAIAMKLQAANSTTEMLTQQLTVAEDQAVKAQKAVNQNAMSLQEMSAKRMEMLGKLQAAKMQESVNSAMDQLNATVGDDAPSLKEIEDKIERRSAEASAKAELSAGTPEGAMAELKESVNLAEADATLDSLRSELGLGPAPALPASTPPSGSSPSS